MDQTAPIQDVKPLAPARWPLVDLARGAALVAMIIYHFSWDLSWYGLTSVDVPRHPGWAMFAHVIAASFLGLVGVGFALAARGELDRGRYLRRLIIVGGAAALVTAGTLVAMPEAPVLFGILHCITVASVLIVPFLRWPVLASIAVAAILLAAPAFFTSPMFNGAAWTWFGFGDRNIPAVDHVPLAPWAGFVFAGYALARVVLEGDAFASLRDAIANWRSASPPARLLVSMGRWSLVIYLAHQLVLMAALYPFAPSSPPQRASTDDEAATFVSACEQTCRTSGGDAPSCKNYCGCAMTKLKPTPYWRAILQDRVPAEDQSKIIDLTRSCASTAKTN
ncbi:heparan-alpha-glucosaminide N-acetyltransferase [Terrarubrum flagellatum]|uniref:heparan-alpha-glucosaminide N-acetyltransferase n=1 Tax=Terrirubrum flagellatum TaxID=2895980 RepID=UPI0031454557